MYTRRSQPGFMQRARQRGVILVVALIFLILLTLLAIGASSGSLLQQRMVAATRNAQLAVMSGDTALRGAEWALWSSAAAVGSTFACGTGAIDSSTGCVIYDPTTPPYSATGDVTQFQRGSNTWLSLTGPITYKGTGGGTDFTTGHGTADVAKNPQYIIEDMGLAKPPGAGAQHESGVTGTTSGGTGTINIHVYRITARATGGNANVVRVVQSTFDAQTNN